jgi:GDP-L-fucose synthase
MNDSVTDFYKGQKVAVFGGAGMIGHLLVAKLLEAGAEAYVIDDFSRGKASVDGAKYIQQKKYGSNPDGSIYITEWPVIMEGPDAGDYRSYEDVLKDLKIAVAFNLAAAVAGVLHNQSNHLQMYDDNVRVLAGPLRACELAGVEHFLQTSSVCVYAEQHQRPCREECGFEGTPHEANAGYAESKRDGERMARWSNIPRVVIARPSNVIGLKDYYDDLAHVVPAFIKRAVEESSEEDFIAYGSSSVTREFIYSGDVAEGMMYALALGDDREAYNIGANGGNFVTMYTLASKILEYVERATGKPSGRKILFQSDRGGGDLLRYSDATKLRSLGWRHRVPLDTILKCMIEEYLSTKDGDS